MRTVTAREANQQFSKLLAAAAAGEEIVITRHGKPIARLAPVAGVVMTPEREAAIKRMKAMMEAGVDLGGLRFSRDEAYER